MRKSISVLFIILLLCSAAGLFAAGKSEGGGEVTFYMNNGSEPESLDPALISGAPEHRIYMNIFEGLVIYDPKTADVIPGVAESWTISPDGTIYTFKLRNCSWTDGVKITAQTVVDSWLRILDPATAAPYAWFPGMIIKGAAAYNDGSGPREGVAIKAVDERTFQMELVGPIPYALGMLAHYAFAIFPMHAITKYGPAWTLPENFGGNGPFVRKEWRPQEMLILARNPKYWDAAAVKIDTVVMYPIDIITTAHTMYLNGEIDWDTNVPLDQIDAIRNRPDYHVDPQLASYYYCFNMIKKPFDDVRVRRALSMAIDRDRLVTQVTKSGEIPAYSMTPPMSGYVPPAMKKGSIEEAQRLLAEAGYPGGKGFPKFVVLYNTSENHKKIAEFILGEWERNLGISGIELVNQEFKTYLTTRRQNQFDVSRAGWIGDYQDPNTFLELFLSTSTLNGQSFQSPEFDALLEQAARMPSGKARYETLAKAENILLSTQAIIPLYFYVNQNMIDLTKWGGWYQNVLDIHPLKNVYLK